jgi:HD-GYP domain-containing protein (c-di-GMP phosphodiesterase class II)/DNA-binding CsgD family transcriptional regulator
VPTIRVTEVLAALSLTTDLASGVPFEKGLATCAVSTAFAQVLGLDTADQHAVFHTALLRAVGCTSSASENAALFVDDTAFQAALKAIDPGDPAVFGAQMAKFGDWAGAAAQPSLARRFLDLAATEGVRATGAACEVSRALGPKLGLPVAAVDALDHVLERWDGLGMPGRCSGEDLPLIARIVHVGEQAAWAHAQRGRAAAVAEVRRRGGGHLDPDLAERFVAEADAVLAVLDTQNLLAAVVAAEPGNAATVGPDGLATLCEALAIVVDLKGRYLLGHSAHVATLADAAAALSGVAAADRGELRAAALLHDLGRAGVASSVWDRPGPLGAADWERVRLHAYWTGRVLDRCPALQTLAGVAAAHHERLDGRGYHRGAAAGELSQNARLLAAADVFAAATEDRPHRQAMTADEAARLVVAEAAGNRLDREACAAVIEAAGLPRPRRAWPCDLTDREVDVLRLAARGLSNRQIAGELVLSDRTVETHLKHVYDKTGRRTRAGAAVFAMEHDLLISVDQRM